MGKGLERSQFDRGLYGTDTLMIRGYIIFQCNGLERSQ